MCNSSFPKGWETAQPKANAPTLVSEKEKRRWGAGLNFLPHPHTPTPNLRHTASGLNVKRRPLLRCVFVGKHQPRGGLSTRRKNILWDGPAACCDLCRKEKWAVPGVLLVGEKKEQLDPGFKYQACANHMFSDTVTHNISHLPSSSFYNFFLNLKKSGIFIHHVIVLLLP